MAKAPKNAAKKEVAAPAVQTKTATITHNSVDPVREKVFIAGFAQIKAEEASMASHKGKLAQTYKYLESAGFSKEHIAFAKTLEKKNVAEVIADFRAKIEICMIMGHQAGRQLDMLEKDRTPIEDQAYLDGLAAGKLGRSASNPYGMETIAGQRWQEGMNEGHSIRNAAINEAVNGDNLIKGSDDEDGSEGSDEEGDSAGEGEEGDDTSEAGSDVGGSGGDGDGKLSIQSGDVREDPAAPTEGASDVSGEGDGDATAVAVLSTSTDDDDDWNDADPNK